MVCTRLPRAAAGALALGVALASCGPRSAPTAAIQTTPGSATEAAPSLTGAVIPAEPTLFGWPPPPPREGIGNTLTGRLVRTGERLPLSPYASWIKDVQNVQLPGLEVVIRLAGSAKPVDATAIPLRHTAGGHGERSWMLTSRTGEFTSVLTVHQSPAYFQRADLDCVDETALLEARTVATGLRTLVWLELAEQWLCRYNGVTTEGQDTQPAVTGPLERDRRSAFLALVEPDGQLRRLASGIPLEEKLRGAAKGTLVATFATDATLSIKEGARGATPAQRKWIGRHALEPLALRAAAVPSPIDEPLLDGEVPSICGQAGIVGKLAVEVEPPLSIEPWVLNPEVLVLSVPGGEGRLTLRAVTVGPDGSRTDVTKDPCLRFQVVGRQNPELGAVSALRRLPQPGAFEGTYLDGESVLVFFRGERRIVRLDAVAPAPSPLPAAASELLTSRFPGLRLPSPADRMGWSFYQAGSGRVIADLDGDGRDDVAVVLVDGERWRLVVLRQRSGGSYVFAFEDGSERAGAAPGGRVHELVLERTTGANLSLRRWGGGPREEWIVRWRGDRFERLVLPALGPAEKFGIIPHAPPLDTDRMTAAELARSLWSGDAEAFAAAAALDREAKKNLAHLLLAQLQLADGDRTRGFAALAVLGEVAAEPAVPFLTEVLFPPEGRYARPWRASTEELAASTAFERMGDRALDVLVERLDDNAAGLMAEAIVRDIPGLRAMVLSKARGPDGRYRWFAATALRSAPIENATDMDEALAMEREFPPLHSSGIPRIATAARTLRGPARDALARAVPVLESRLGIWEGEAGLAVADALGRIGPPAKSALPALQRALLDPSCRLRATARSAISTIEGRPVRASEGHSDTAVECDLGSSPYAIHPVGRARPEAHVPARQPGRMLVVRGLTSADADDKRFGFPPPIAVDWRELGRRRLQRITIDENDKATGPLVEEVRRRRESYYDGVVSGQVAFSAPIAPALAKLNYYAVTESGAIRIMPRRYEGTAEISVREEGRPANVRFRGLVGAEVAGNGFVLISDSPLEITRSSDATSLAALWPGVLDGEALAAGDEKAAPRGFRFSIRILGRTEEYVFAILPPDLTNCADRKRLLRVIGGEVKRIGVLDEDCDV